jgi:hypothetical protein
MVAVLQRIACGATKLHRRLRTEILVGTAVLAFVGVLRWL